MNESDQHTDVNQTLFRQHQPLYDPQDQMVKNTVIKPKTIWLVGSILILIVVLATMMAYFLSNPTTPINSGEELTPTPKKSVQHSPNQIENMMVELEEQLEEADPSQTSQTFPPIDKEIQISK